MSKEDLAISYLVPLKMEWNIYTGKSDIDWAFFELFHSIYKRSLWGKVALMRTNELKFSKKKRVALEKHRRKSDPAGKDKSIKKQKLAPAPDPSTSSEKPITSYSGNNDLEFTNKCKTAPLVLKKAPWAFKREEPSEPSEPSWVVGGELDDTVDRVTFVPTEIDGQVVYLQYQRIFFHFIILSLGCIDMDSVKVKIESIRRIRFLHLHFNKLFR